MYAFHAIGALLYGTVGTVLLLLGGLAATDSANRPLYPDEYDSVIAAYTFAHEEHDRTGSWPTSSRLHSRLESLPGLLTLDGNGFGCSVNDGKLECSWFSGGDELRWSPDQPDVAVFAPEQYFLFGSRVKDLLVLLSFGVAALAAAWWVFPGGRSRGAS